MLFPIRIDAAVQRTRQAWASKLQRQRHIGDLSAWEDDDTSQKAFERLLRDLQEGDDLVNNGDVELGRTDIQNEGSIAVRFGPNQGAF